MGWVNLSPNDQWSGPPAKHLWTCAWVTKIAVTTLEPFFSHVSTLVCDIVYMCVVVHEVAAGNLENDNLQDCDKRLCVYFCMCLESRTCRSRALPPKCDSAFKHLHDARLKLLPSLCLREKQVREKWADESTLDLNRFILEAQFKSGCVI